MEHQKRSAISESSREQVSELVIRTGALAGRRIVLPPPPGAIVFGRDASCDVQFDPERDRVVGRQHARLESTWEGIYLEDLNSRNGTFLNGNPLFGRRRLEAGAWFQLGQDGPVVELASTEQQPAHTMVVRPGRSRAASAVADVVHAGPVIENAVRGGTVFLPSHDDAATRPLPVEAGSSSLRAETARVPPSGSVAGVAVPRLPAQEREASFSRAETPASGQGEGRPRDLAPSAERDERPLDLAPSAERDGRPRDLAPSAEREGRPRDLVPSAEREGRPRDLTSSVVRGRQSDALEAETGVQAQRPAVAMERQWDSAVLRQVLIIGAILLCAGLVGLGFAFLWPPSPPLAGP